jgi:hypothetical protein
MDNLLRTLRRFPGVVLAPAIDNRFTFISEVTGAEIATATCETDTRCTMRTAEGARSSEAMSRVTPDRILSLRP